MHLLGACHPTIYKLITGLKDQQSLTELKVHQFRAGNEQPVCKKYAESANQRQNTVKRGLEGFFTPMEFINAVAHCLS
jgi:hypothetical protein